MSLIERLRQQYPDFETLTEQAVSLVMTAGGPVQQIGAPRLKLKFQHGTLPLALQLWEGMFAINATRPYRGWAAIRGELLAAWQMASEIISPTAVTRIGMR